MSFDTVLQSIAEESDRTALASIAVKYPNLKPLVEGGERFNSFRETFLAAGGKEENVIRAHELAPSMFKWAQDNFDYEAGMTHSEKTAQDRIAALESEVDQLQAGKDADMTIDEVIASLQAKGLVITPEERKGIVTRQDLEGALLKQSARFEQVYAELTPMTADHYKRFGDAIPMSDVISVMNKEGVDAKTAYQRVVAPREAVIVSEKHKQEVEEAEKRGEQKGLERAKELVGRQAMPVDTAGGARGISRFAQRVLDRRAEANKSNPGRLGDGSAAAVAGAAHRQKELTSATA